MSKIKILYGNGNETTKNLIEKHGFEAVPFREPTPEENVLVENIENFIEEAVELGMLVDPDGLAVKDLLLTWLILNTSAESK